ncbi:MAG: hypothetical protein AB1546_04050 [bacterium]
MKRIVLFIGVLLTLFLSSPIRASEQPVEVLDKMNFDGALLHYTYTVLSDCPAADMHKTVVEVKQTGIFACTAIVKLRVQVKDSSEETECIDSKKPIKITGKANLRQLAEEYLEEKGGCESGDVEEYRFEFPPVKISPRSPNLSDLPEMRIPNPESASPVRKVRVVRKTYQPMFECILYKRDGSRKDGFKGTAETMEDAVQKAIAGCHTTNNPRCMEYAKDPAHTTCKFNPIEKEIVEEYDSDKLPNLDGATVSWSCPVGKSNDDDDCIKSYVIEESKPYLIYRCVLYKNDGSRRDGFEGAAETELEARAIAAQGCKRTNHPSCDAFSLDPAHTTCIMKVNYGK